MSKITTDYCYNNSQEYINDGCGLNCFNKPTSKLKIKYINKIGNFCKSCELHLLKYEFAEQISKDERT